MLSFESDYIEGCHEKILERLQETNRIKMSGYGEDDYSKSAKEKIRAYCQCQDADIYFLVGGTQTNQVVIDSLLESYEGVIAAESAHISTHEAGAIERTGHKVITLPAQEGKIDPDQLQQYMKDFREDTSNEHMVFPGMVYITHPTEYGTLYTAEEIKRISDICHQYQLPLYLDGARLGYGLMASESDVDLPYLAKYLDVFYIGGTKVGALCGEAVVFTKKHTPKHFFTQIKQHGALLAKGRLTGLQFDTLFTDDLYFKISRHADYMAEKLRDVFARHHYEFYIDSHTNQQFVIMSNQKLKKLMEHVIVTVWEKLDDMQSVVRFATSFATTPEDITKLDQVLSMLE